MTSGIDHRHLPEAVALISEELAKVNSDPSTVKAGGCVACHVLSKVASSMQIGEVAAGDIVTEALSQNPELNDTFISAVENLHMKQRFLGIAFALKTREAKDRFIEGNFRNALDELLSDASSFGTGVVLRKLVMEHIALQLAQNIGVDYHAASEELYYYMRKNDDESHSAILALINSVVKKAGRTGHQQ